MRTLTLTIVATLSACSYRPADPIVGRWRQENFVDRTGLEDYYLVFSGNGTVERLNRDKDVTDTWTWKRIDAKYVDLTPKGGGKVTRCELMSDLFRYPADPETWVIYRREPD